MMSCASGNSRRLSIKFMCVTLPYMSICAGIVVAVALQQVNGTPDAEACAESYNEGLKNGNCTVEKSHIVISLPLRRKIVCYAPVCVMS